MKELRLLQPLQQRLPQRQMAWLLAGSKGETGRRLHKPWSTGLLR